MTSRERFNRWLEAEKKKGLRYFHASLAPGAQNVSQGKLDDEIWNIIKQTHNVVPPLYLEVDDCPLSSED